MKVPGSILLVLFRRCCPSWCRTRLVWKHRLRRHWTCRSSSSRQRTEHWTSVRWPSSSSTPWVPSVRRVETKKSASCGTSRTSCSFLGKGRIGDLLQTCNSVWMSHSCLCLCVDPISVFIEYSSVLCLTGLFLQSWTKWRLTWPTLLSVVSGRTCCSIQWSTRGTSFRSYSTNSRVRDGFLF